MPNSFFKFSEEHLAKAIEAKLTANEYKLWLYLCLLNPYRDRPVEIPPVEVIERKLNFNKTTYYRAKTTLQEKGLWDFSEQKITGRNLLGESYCQNQSIKGEV